MLPTRWPVVAAYLSNIAGDEAALLSAIRQLASLRADTTDVETGSDENLLEILEENYTSPSAEGWRQHPDVQVLADFGEELGKLLDSDDNGELSLDEVRRFGQTAKELALTSVVKVDTPTSPWYEFKRELQLKLKIGALPPLRLAEAIWAWTERRQLVALSVARSAPYFSVGIRYGAKLPTVLTITNSGQLKLNVGPAMIQRHGFHALATAAALVAERTAASRIRWEEGATGLRLDFALQALDDSQSRVLTEAIFDALRLLVQAADAASIAVRVATHATLDDTVRATSIDPDPAVEGAWMESAHQAEPA